MILIILFLITSEYIDGQIIYVRNDFVCYSTNCSLIQYQLQIVGNVYNLTNYNIKSNLYFKTCNILPEFKLSNFSGMNNLVRGLYECEILEIPLDYFFTSDVASTVDVTCESNTNCSRYRYDRIGSSVTSTRIGACTYNSCRFCNFRSPWQLNSTSMMLQKRTKNCEETREMNIDDYFILVLPIATSTDTTKAKVLDSTSKTSQSILDSTSKTSQSTLIWSFGTITVNLINCLLMNGLK